MSNTEPIEQTKLFELGRLVATPNALHHVCGYVITEAINRHSKGDWGSVCAEDWNENNRSLKDGCRILSSYTTADGVKFWIITEADRSVTTVLLPEDY